MQENSRTAKPRARLAAQSVGGSLQSSRSKGLGLKPVSPLAEGRAPKGGGDTSLRHPALSASLDAWRAPLTRGLPRSLAVSPVPRWPPLLQFPVWMASSRGAPARPAPEGDLGAARAGSLTATRSAVRSEAAPGQTGGGQGHGVQSPGCRAGAAGLQGQVAAESGRGRGSRPTVSTNSRRGCSRRPRLRRARREEARHTEPA